MNKIIVYTVVDNGIDGSSPDHILYASLDEGQLKQQLNRDKSKAFRTMKEQIVDMDAART